jgi:hypothetical protein
MKRLAASCARAAIVLAVAAPLVALPACGHHQARGPVAPTTPPAPMTTSAYPPASPPSYPGTLDPRTSGGQSRGPLSN